MICMMHCIKMIFKSQLFSAELLHSLLLPGKMIAERKTNNQPNLSSQLHHACTCSTACTISITPANSQREEVKKKSKITRQSKRERLFQIACSNNLLPNYRHQVETFKMWNLLKSGKYRQKPFKQKTKEEYTQIHTS